MPSGSLASRDENRNVTIQGVSKINFSTPTNIAVNPDTGAMVVEGTVTITPSGTQDVNLIQVGGVAFSLGQQLAAASLPVVLTAAQISTLTPLSTISVTQGTSPWVVSLTSTTITGTVAVKETRAATSTVTQVGDSASSVTLLAANANRLKVSITNLSSAILYIKSGTTATATDNTAVLFQYGYWEDDTYTGRIDGIWASDAGGVASITEYT